MKARKKRSAKNTRFRPGTTGACEAQLWTFTCPPGFLAEDNATGIHAPAAPRFHCHGGAISRHDPPALGFTAGLTETVLKSPKLKKPGTLNTPPTGGRRQPEGSQFETYSGTQMCFDFGFSPTFWLTGRFDLLGKMATAAGNRSLRHSNIARWLASHRRAITLSG
jgi:hypothetical protein